MRDYTGDEIDRRDCLLSQDILLWTPLVQNEEDIVKPIYTKKFAAAIHATRLTGAET